ncbi:MAG: conditioned medium factor [Xanthomonadales bacterium]|nr:conditioned medium factor [Xanthomonadales bacterium]
MNYKLVTGLTASMVLATQITSANPMAKQLAGPADEIELMQKAAPADNAIISKHAMIAVNFTENAHGQKSWNQNILIDGENPKVLLFSPDKTQWQLSIKQEGMQKSSHWIDVEYAASETTFGMAQERFPATQFDLQNLKSGRYDFSINTEISDETEGYLLISSDSPYRLKSFVSTQGQLVGDVINLSANAFADESEFTVVKNDLQLINSAYMKVTNPAGQTREISLFDDGAEFDKAAFDGEFNGSFVADQEGLYRVQVVAQGTTPKGKPFYRTVEHVIPVIASDLQLTSKDVVGQYSGGHKIDLSFGLDTMKADARFRVFAEVWGSKTNGKAEELVPVTWLSTIAGVNKGQINLQLDDRWLIAEGVKAPFELKNIRIEDTQYYINMLDVKRLPLQLPNISAQSKSSYDGGLYESMLKGDKPESLKAREKAAGGKLMLVHGYCSGDAWGPVQSQFSNSVKFTDFNQNRTHDAFARLIDSYGDNFPSFGVVAHSQGGAASLHLYTYYWSGLDNAGSGRLIQSVGTPYQGTPLAGNLAALGDIFGVGCGYNANLTVSGASSWLSGIPTWARSKVNYYTTSFTDKWWRYDYCNMASDLVLSDPEDGTTEKSRGQLSGAVNRGHTTGQCHTEGMRDMAQTRDGSRNSSMSANAAR